MIPAVRNGRFFFFDNQYFALPGANITGEPYLSQEDAVQLGWMLPNRLSALAATLPDGEMVRRSLELDGFRVDTEKLELVPADSVVSEQEEEDRVAFLVGQSGLPAITSLSRHRSQRGFAKIHRTPLRLFHTSVLL